MLYVSHSTPIVSVSMNDSDLGELLERHVLPM